MQCMADETATTQSGCMGALKSTNEALKVIITKPGQNPNPYRLISLLQVDLKILAKILASRVNIPAQDTLFIVAVTNLHTI